MCSKLLKYEIQQKLGIATKLLVKQLRTKNACHIHESLQILHQNCSNPKIGPKITDLFPEIVSLILGCTVWTMSLRHSCSVENELEVFFEL